MLYALLFGCLLNPFFSNRYFQPGINISAKQILRIGVCLLGARITLDQIASLGGQAVLLAILGILFTITAGLFIAKALGFQRSFAVVMASSVAICGASAALAVAAVLPKSEQLERETGVTVVGVTVLSTIAMVLYPLATKLVGYDDLASGIFIGATIHDVAQVVAAGYVISDQAGETATIVKLMRVAFLVPVVACISFHFSKDETSCTGLSGRRIPFPAFLLGFLLLAAINSSHVVGTHIMEQVAAGSKYCLLIAVAAIGLKTSFLSLFKTGGRPMLSMTLTTIALALFSILFLSLFLT